MQEFVLDFLSGRLDSVVEFFRKNNAEYALAAERKRSLYDAISPMMHVENSMTISEGDGLNLRDYFEQDFIMTAIMEEELYKQGYLDCIQLLRLIGVLA